MDKIAPGGSRRVGFVVLLEGVPTYADESSEVPLITAVLSRNGSASGVTVTITKLADEGNYDATFTLPELGDTLALGDALQLRVTPTVDSEEQPPLGPVWEGFVAAALTAEAIRAAVGLAAADLDAQLEAIPRVGATHQYVNQQTNATAIVSIEEVP